MAGKDDNLFVLPVRPELGGERLELDRKHKKETKTETTNLVGRLHACIGDVIVVTSAGLDISGFVTKYDRDMIELSHENPHSAHYGESGYQGRLDVSIGNRQYRLSKFTDFSVLKAAGPDGTQDLSVNANLVGQFFAQVGDIVVLEADKLRIAGYLSECDKDVVILSHENPLSLYAHRSRKEGYRSSGLTNGQKKYFLNYFHHFDVLQKAADNPR